MESFCDIIVVLSNNGVDDIIEEIYLCVDVDLGFIRNCIVCKIGYILNNFMLSVWYSYVLFYF